MNNEIYTGFRKFSNVRNNIKASRLSSEFVIKESLGLKIKSFSLLKGKTIDKNKKHILQEKQKHLQL